jgi:hypothetical protein
MTSARTHCPKCGGQAVSELSELLFAPNVDFFGCKRCRHIWHVDKGQEGPAGYALLAGSSIGGAPAVDPLPVPAPMARKHQD